MFDKLFKRNKLKTKTSEHIKLCKDKRVIEMAERDFNSVIHYLNNVDIIAGDTITLTSPDKVELMFIIRKNKNNGK